MCGEGGLRYASDVSTRSNGGELERLQKECDLYRRLLDLGRSEDIAVFLPQALELLTEIVGAHQGYLELYDDDGAPQQAPRWFTQHGFSASELDAIRTQISKGVIAHAVATGTVINTPSAMLDERFRARESVRLGQIEAVVCAPIGDDPPIGVLYLQRRVRPGAFGEEDKAEVGMVARALAPFAERLLARERAAGERDPTAPLRARFPFQSLVGRSPALAALLHEMSLVCPLDVTVLITGEAGTGKSTVARVIHEASGRFGRPFIEADCARTPPELLERELFGVGDGAGRLAAADGGTLYIDDIQTLPASVQTKLLHFLETGTYYPLMSATQLSADVRILAGGGNELEQAVEERHFRADLFHRLQMLRVRVPTLAERGEDLVELAQHLVDAACRKHRLRALTLSRGARRALQSVEWPGNVRELASVVEAGAVRASGERATRIEAGHLFPDAGQQSGETLTFQKATHVFQKQYLIDALRSTGGNVLETARRLDLARSHVYNLIKAFGIDMELVRR